MFIQPHGINSCREPPSTSNCRWLQLWICKWHGSRSKVFKFKLEKKRGKEGNREEAKGIVIYSSILIVRSILKDSFLKLYGSYKPVLHVNSYFYILSGLLCTKLFILSEVTCRMLWLLLIRSVSMGILQIYIN